MLLDPILEFSNRPHPLTLLGHSKDPYLVGTSVILAGNCTDAAVNKVTPKLFELAPTPEAFLKLDKEVILPLLPGISHNGSKIEYIKNWATFLISTGLKPTTTLEELTTITGIGRKTGAVIQSVCLGKTSGFPIDTHCERVLNRLSNTTFNVKRLERDMVSQVTPETSYTYHMALTNFGRSVCTSRNPQCNTCPLSSNCKYPTLSPSI